MTRLLLAATYLVYVIAWLSCLESAEVAAFIGLIGAGASVVLIIVGIMSRHVWGWSLGAAHCGLYVSLFVVVVIGGLSPQEARMPFLVIGGFYLAAVAPWTIAAARQRPTPRHPMMCVKCGYLLYGLTEARCPECGTAFDPKLLNQPIGVCM